MPAYIAAAMAWKKRRKTKEPREPGDFEAAAVADELVAGVLVGDAVEDVLHREADVVDVDLVVAALEAGSPSDESPSAQGPGRLPYLRGSSPASGAWVEPHGDWRGEHTHFASPASPAPPRRRLFRDRRIGDSDFKLESPLTPLERALKRA